MAKAKNEIIINARGDTRIVTNSFVSPLVARRSLAYRLGRAFEGERDYYQVLGYDLEPDIDDYLARYTRDDIAGRVVDLPAQDTWKRRPVLIDGDSRSDDEEPASEFLAAWQRMTDAGSDQALNVYHYFERVDRLTGIGRYGVLLIGLRDGKELNEAVSGKLSGPEGILYLSAFSEASALIGPSDINQDPQDRRFGKPEQYQVDLFGTGGRTAVHWSRVIHVAEDMLEDEVYGRPRLERIFNRLDDLMKIVGGSAEATWKLMRKGLAVIAKEGYQMPQDDDAKKDFAEQLEEYDHGLRRILRLGGVDVEELGSEVVDPSGIFKIIISLISAASDIPQRILIGSERGELASSQDLRAWAAVIANRQTNFAEPVILRPFVNWCIQIGALPKPVSGKYRVEWPRLYELTELEEAERAKLYAEAILRYVEATASVDVVPPDEFREKYLGLPPGEGMMEPEEESEEERQAFEELATARARNGNG